VDDLNIIGHIKDIDEARNHLKMEFEMKNLSKAKFYLGLQLEHLHTGILIHQSAYAHKILKKFNMDKAYLARTPFVVCALEKDKDSFRLKEEGEDVLGLEYSYISVIGALMYLTNNTRSDIAFAVNCLARHSVVSTMHHWNSIKNILRYLVDTIDLGLFFQKNQDSKLIGYADTGYLSDPHNARSQTGYMFLHGETTIYWKSCKQTLIATSTNHSEIIELYEASRERAWLRKMIDHIQKLCGIGAIKSPTIIYEDNAACVAQMQTGYIKTNYMKYIYAKKFYLHELQEGGEISILQIKSCDSLVDLFMKSLPLATFDKCVKDIDMCRLKDL
jgi:hypothetical protein